MKTLIKTSILFLMLASLGFAQQSGQFQQPAGGTGSTGTSSSGSVLPARSYGAVGRVNFSNNGAVAAGGTAALTISGSPSFTTGPAQAGDLIEFNGGAFSAPTHPTPALNTSGCNSTTNCGTLPASATISFLQSCVTAGSATTSMSESAPSTSTTATTGGGSTDSWTVTFASCPTTNGVAAAAYGTYVGPVGAERFVPATITGYIKSTSSTASALTFNLDQMQSVNMFANGLTAVVSGLSGTNCSGYNGTWTVATATGSNTSQLFTVANASNPGTCSPASDGTVVLTLCTPAAGWLGTIAFPGGGAGYCAVADTTMTGGNYNIDGMLPVQNANGYMLSTISVVNSATSVTLADNVPNTFSSTRVVWGQDNFAKITSAISACPGSPSSNSTNGNSGCTILFDGPGTQFSPNGWYATSQPINLPSIGLNSTPQNMMLTCNGPAYGIQAANGYASGLALTQDKPPCGIVPFGRIYAVTSGVFNTLTQGAELYHIGLLDLTGIGNQTYAWGVAQGGFFGQTIAASNLDHVASYGMTLAQYEGGTTASQSNRIMFCDVLGAYDAVRLLNSAVDTQIWGGEWSGVGQAGLGNSSATSVNNTSATAVARGIGLDAENQANTLRIYGTDIQNFGTGVFCNNVTNCNIEPGLRMEEVGQSNLANSDPVYIDSSGAGTTTGNWRYDSPEIASNGFAHCFTVTAAVTSQGTVIADCNTTSSANILNNGTSVLTTFLGTDPNNTVPQVTVNPALQSYQSTAILKSNAALTAVTQNNINLMPFEVKGQIVQGYSHLAYDVQTQDATTTNNYDIGIYGPNCSNGATNVPLLAHTGTVTAATLGTAGVHNIVLASGEKAVFTPGWYCFAITSNAATPAEVLGGDTAGLLYAPFAAPTSIAGGGSTLPSTITAPATVQSGDNQVWFRIY